MRREILARGVRRVTASVVLLTYLASCTHMPSGQKAFNNFEECIAANLGLAAAGGLAIGALGKNLARQLTGDSRLQNVVGTTAGVAAAVMIGLTAWRKCAAVYNTSEPIAQPPSAAPPPAIVQRRQPGLNMERLEVRVEGTENDPPIPEFDFTYIAEDVAAKDIKVQFRHKVEIVRFKADDNDKLVLADDRGEAMRDSSGKSIPLEAAMRMPRERLHWVTIADEGKDDYVEDVIIQQGQPARFRHKLQIPPRAQLPLPLPVPMRYTVTVEAGQFKAARTVDFALLGTGGRPKRFSAAAAVQRNAQPAPAAAVPVAAAPVAPAAKTEEPARAAPAAADGFVATHTLKRGVPVYDEASAKHKSTGRLNKETPVRIEAQTEITVNNKPAEWVKVVTKSGAGGWLQASELIEVK